MMSKRDHSSIFAMSSKSLFPNKTFFKEKKYRGKKKPTEVQMVPCDFAVIDISKYNLHSSLLRNDNSW